MFRPTKIKHYLARMQQRGFNARAVLEGSQIDPDKLDSQTYLTLSQNALSRRADLDDRELTARLAEIALETALFLPPAGARLAR